MSNTVLKEQLDELLLHACHKKYFETIKILIENGANIHAQDDDALCWSARYGHLQTN